MSTEKEANYYFLKKKIFMRTFDAAMLIVKQILIENFGEDKFIEISTATRKEFENLLLEIPYIGGDANPLTDELINAALLLPLFQAFEKEGLKFDEIGKLTYELFEIFYKFIPPADDIFSNTYQDKKKEQAIDSKLRKYTGDWVFDFIEGDDKTFTFGVDYSECGVYKFYKSKRAEHFMPWVCISDYVKARAYGYGFNRTQTIGNGAKICDFRYVKDGNTPRAWPPDNLQEVKKK